LTTFPLSAAQNWLANVLSKSPSAVIKNLDRIVVLYHGGYGKFSQVRNRTWF